MDILKVRDYAWMSQAAYLGLEEVLSGQRTLTSELQLDAYDKPSRFAANQADTFTDPATGYSFIHQRPNTTSGFSATVFASNVEVGYTIAVRGTEPANNPGSDLLEADGLGVVLSGEAKLQTFDAYRYYKQLSTAAGQAVTYTQQELASMALLATGKANPALLSGQYDLSGDIGL